MYLETLKKKVWGLGEIKLSSQAVPAHRSLLQVQYAVGTPARIFTEGEDHNVTASLGLRGMVPNMAALRESNKSSCSDEPKLTLLVVNATRPSILPTHF